MYNKNRCIFHISDFSLFEAIQFNFLVQINNANKIIKFNIEAFIYFVNN
ncbi:unnamed protein product [Paramecium octaurelia]|uniref:Uncharacterized protein n=1 Tax=Paramecium octaurelia TaxID=43137 RepID=A0A8S1U4M6_PAROT|nr:unnamed protein product [Paramecium octaurelia]